MIVEKCHTGLEVNDYRIWRPLAFASRLRIKCRLTSFTSGQVDQERPSRLPWCFGWAERDFVALIIMLVKELACNRMDGLAEEPDAIKRSVPGLYR